jgi:hypothetical protein
MYQLALALENEKDRGVYADIANATTQFIEFV